MFNIQKYLEKFSKGIQDKEFFVEQILSVIKTHTGIILSPNEVEIKNYIIYLKSSPAVLNKIFINKTKILTDLLVLAPSLKITDIK